MDAIFKFYAIFFAGSFTPTLNPNSSLGPLLCAHFVVSRTFYPCILMLLLLLFSEIRDPRFEIRQIKLESSHHYHHGCSLVSFNYISRLWIFLFWLTFSPPGKILNAHKRLHYSNAQNKKKTFPTNWTNQVFFRQNLRRRQRQRRLCITNNNSDSTSSCGSRNILTSESSNSRSSRERGFTAHWTLYNENNAQQ